MIKHGFRRVRTGGCGTTSNLIAESLTLKGLPHTAGAPAGYGDLAEVVNGALTGRAVGNGASIFQPIRFGADLSVMTGDVVLSSGVAPNGQQGVKLTLTTTSRISILPAVGQVFEMFLSAAVLGGKEQGVDQVRLDAVQDSAANKVRFGSYTTGNSPLNTFAEQGGVYTVAFDKNNLGSLNAADSEFPIVRMEIRVTPVAGQTAELWLFGVGVLKPRRKSRVCVVYDDGYKSSFKLGLHPFQSRGIPATISVIPTAHDAGLSSYMTVQELKSWVNSGNAVVAHGPIGGTGSLTDNYTDPATRVQQAVDDIKMSIQWVRNKGLATPFFDRCYIWPQGKFQWSSGDTSLLDAVLGAGVNTARAALPTAVSFHRTWDSLTKYNRLAVPHIGHNWPGTTAAEVTNINNIVSIINTLSDHGGIDFHLMLHRVVPDSTPDGDMAISIRVTDLNTIAAAIKANIDSGKLEAVTMPQTVIDDNAWNQL